MSGSFELRRLRYFVKVGELRSLTRAAQVLHIAQPALSHHIRALEEELGLQLLERGPRGVTLTEAGVHLLHEARETLSRVRTMVERVKAETATPEGEVIIGVGQTIGSLLMVPLLEAVAKKLPRVKIQIREMMSGMLPDLVRSRSVDFALSYNVATGDGVEAHGILKEDMCLVGQRRLMAAFVSPHAATVNVESLGGVPLYLSHRSHVMRELIERCARSRHVKLNILAEVDSLYIMKELVFQGAGCCVLSTANVYRELDRFDLRLVRIVKPSIRREVCLVRRQGQVMSRSAREVARLAAQMLLEMVRDDVWRAVPLRKITDIQTLF